MVLSLYCLVISLYSGIAMDHATAFSKSISSEQPAFNKAIAAGSFFHTAQSEISAATCNTARPAPVKNTYNEIIAGFKVTEQQFSHRFLQYSFYSKNLLLRLQKTTLIFPFHYFW